MSRIKCEKGGSLQFYPYVMQQDFCDQCLAIVVGGGEALAVEGALHIFVRDFWILTKL